MANRCGLRAGVPSRSARSRSLLSTFLCPDCGNTRPWLPELRPFCSSAEAPTDGPEYVVYNLETGAPTVEDALRTLDRVLERASACGIRGLIVIHGYGSGGRGGAIRHAFRDGMEQNYWAHRISDAVRGEDLRPGAEAYTSLVDRRPALKQALRREMMGNSGITVVLLKRGGRAAP